MTEVGKCRKVLVSELDFHWMIVVVIVKLPLSLCHYHCHQALKMSACHSDIVIARSRVPQTPRRKRHDWSAMEPLRGSLSQYKAEYKEVKNYDAVFFYHTWLTAIPLNHASNHVLTAYTSPMTMYVSAHRNAY